MTDESTIALTRDGSVATLCLNRPPQLNALSPRTLEDLLWALEEVEGDDTIRILKLCGSGRAFSVGFDLQAMAALVSADGLPSEGKLREMADQGALLLERLRGANAITVGSAHGYAFGGGFLLFAACDFRICADDVIFGLPEIDIGLPLIWGGMALLKEELGASLARDVVMTGRRFHPGDLVGTHFLKSCVPEEGLGEATDNLIETLLEKPPVALKLMKEQTRPDSNPSEDADLLIKAVSHPDFLATAMAYLQRYSAK